MQPITLKWIAWYLVFSVLLFVVVRLVSYFKLNVKTLREKDDSLAFFLGAVAVMILFWPVVLVVFGVGTLLDYPRMFSLRWFPRPYRFQCRREHLRDKVTPAAAESMAIVVDPRGKVPALPFGHLNGAWNVFLAKRKFGYSLRSFCVPGYIPSPEDGRFPSWSTPQRRKLGYAWVGLWRSQVKAEFVYEWN